jgi:hypothetical protein
MFFFLIKLRVYVEFHGTPEVFDDIMVIIFQVYFKEKYMYKKKIKN